MHRSVNRVVWPLIGFLFLLTGCSAPRYQSETATPYYPMAAAIPESRSRLLDVATRQLGTPYRYGGADPRGFDCSGLVHYVHRHIGLAVPRTAAAQRQYAQPIPLRRLKAGDLVFFRIDGGKGNHVGIYEGGGRFIHAPSSGKRVSRAHLSNPYWQRHLTGAGTYL